MARGCRAWAAESPRARARRRGGGGTSSATAPALALHERAILADQQVEMVALLVGELEKDLFAFRVLETLAVLLEEPMRPTLAADPDHQRLLIVDTAHQPFSALGEEAIGRALEEQEGRARLQLWIATQQLAVTRLELAEVLLFFEREIL